MSFVKVKNISDTNVSFGSFVIEPKNTAVLTKNNYFNTIKTFDEIERIAVEIKEEKSVSILDFGAKGDGVLDSTQFIKNAFEYCSENHITCYVPDGVFRTTGVSISNDLSLECSEFGTILGGLTITNGAKIFINHISCSVDIEEISSHVVSGFIGESDLANDSVTETKIKNSSVTHSKLSDDSVDTNNIKNLSVTKDKLDTKYCPFPIGFIYMSATSSNPSLTFEGTTWEAWGTGRVPVGVDTSQVEFNTVQKVGGAKTHTLTAEQMPSHSHQLGWWGVATAQIGTNLSNLWRGDSPSFKTTTSAGGGQAHNNLQPYITCYMWKRTA